MAAEHAQTWAAAIPVALFVSLLSFFGNEIHCMSTDVCPCADVKCVSAESQYPVVHVSYAFPHTLERAAVSAAVTHRAPIDHNATSSIACLGVLPSWA